MAEILFISPHPDDECLSMGMGILNHIWNGHDVYLALLTRGINSSAIEQINGKVYCPWHGKYHNLASEGYQALSRAKFGDARVSEFMYSSACLGVKPKNILIFNYEDGNLSKENVKKVIKDFLNTHQGARIKTTSYLDIHPDHSTCGNGLLELYNSGEVTDARFYISPGQWENTPGSFESNLNCNYFHQASVSVYKRWNPEHDLYGIGYHSVPSLFDAVSQNFRSKYHEPNVH